MTRRGLPALLLLLCLGRALAQPSGQDSRRHWSFQTLRRPTVPEIRNPKSEIRNPVDAFVLAKLGEKGLTMSPEAPRHALVRRLSFDLVGLPPTPEEVGAFVNDARPDAYERLVDRLLASPHLGERWGRHWLDGAGYVDVVGTDNDAGIIKLGDGSKWRYRDWVVRAFNEDRPWQRFLTEQLAGDELVAWRNATTFTPEIIDRLVATGFLRTAADDTDERELNTLDIRHGVVQRTVEVLANNLLGLTLNCAKCHDHKFEPLSQRDYYRIQAIFAPALNPDRWVQPQQRVLAGVPPGVRQHIDKHNAALDALIQPLQKSPDPKAKQQAAALQCQKQKYGTIQAVYDVGPPTPTALLKRGQHDRPGPEVAPGFLAVLCPSDTATALPAATPAGATSGRRLALARHLTDASTPGGALVVRVRVNRVWEQLFGRGIVESSDNLGVTGRKPSHPELLEWLACEFVRQGGELKPFLRLLVTSSTYRQASTYTEAPMADPNNDLLWRQRLRRLESEAVRDSLLAVAGALDRRFGGQPVMTESKPDGSIVVKDSSGANRRGIYLLARRNYHPTLLGVFDQPVLTTNCTRRASAAVVQQSLTMLNEPFVREQSEQTARRLARLAGKDPRRQVETAFQLILGRAATTSETTAALEWLARRGPQVGLPRLCHVLMNTSEFLYVP